MAYTWFRCRLCDYAGEGEVEDYCPNCKGPVIECDELFCPVCGEKVLSPWFHLIQKHNWILKEKTWVRGYDLIVTKYASPKTN